LTRIQSETESTKGVDKIVRMCFPSFYIFTKIQSVDETKEKISKKKKIPKRKTQKKKRTRFNE